MRDGLNHRWAGKHADAIADSNTDPDADADARTVVYPITIQPITIKRAHAITVRATRPDTESDTESARRSSG